MGERNAVVKCTPPEVTKYHRYLFSLPKVELHFHLDGAVRFSTILDVSRSRGIPIQNKKGEVATTEEEVRRMLITDEPANLGHVLEAFDIFFPIIRGDANVIERIAYEACEDQARNGVVYFEGRYAPFMLVGHGITAGNVVEAVHRGFERGERDFGIKARSIICCIRGMDEYNMQLLELASSHNHLGVVAIDVAGSSHGADEQYEDSVVHVFSEARKLGIHRTVHAGESGGAKEVVRALEDMYAERIGHGYRIMNDEALYQKHFVRDKSIHLEACPFSSVLTGSVPLDWKNHPVARWAADDVNFSLSTDDPTCFGNSIMSEMVLCNKEIGLNIYHIWKAQLNAAKASFLPEDEKSELISLIAKAEPMMY